MKPTHCMLTVAFVALVLTGCRSSSLIGTSPPVDNDKKAPPQGVRYYAGKDVVAIKVDVTETKKIEVTESLDILPETRTKRDGTVTLNTVADTTKPFVIDLIPGGRFDNSLIVEVRPNGLLKSINAQSTGKTGEAIVSLAKFAATVVGGIPVGLGGQATDCDPAQPPYNALPLRARATVSSDAVACTLATNIAELEKNVEKFEAERLQLERHIPDANSDELTLHAKRITAIKDAVENLKKRLVEKNSALAVRIEQFVQKNELGTTTKTTSITDMLDLNELPRTDVITEEMDRATVESTLTGRSLEVFKRTSATATIGAVPTYAVKIDHPATEKNRARIYFRQGQPVRLKLFVLGPCVADPQKECTKTMSDQMVDVMHPDIDVQFVEFDENAFAQRKLVLSFDEKGRPDKLERSGTSELATIASSLSTAATTLRDEFATTLTKVGEIQASQRTIELNDLSSELARLKKEKEVLDARIAVEGTALNASNTIEQSRLAAQLAALQADIALKSAQATAEQNIEIAKLKSATALLVEELNLIKARLAAEEARK